MTLWEKFTRTGKISDYLKYKSSTEDEEDDNGQSSDNKRRTVR